MNRKNRKLQKKIIRLINRKTIEISKEDGINISNIIIVDPAHSYSRYNKKKPVDILVDESKRILSIY
ncbi:MAG: hypothetical protein K0Q49_967 [Haloplasmataceae bacterium]|jgi:ribosomal protein L24|nr:hypothetical protein [Haloplasmataceae bacterium]